MLHSDNNGLPCVTIAFSFYISQAQIHLHKFVLLRPRTCMHIHKHVCGLCRPWAAWAAPMPPMHVAAWVRHAAIRMHGGS